MKSADKRILAREGALQFIFHLFFEKGVTDFSVNDKEQLREEIEERMNDLAQSIEPPLHPKNHSFVYKVIEGVVLHFDELEKTVEKYLKNWKLSRISKIEHALLLLGVYEIIYGKETPANVIINEYIELGKKFGNKESGSFINGVLDAVLKAHKGP